MQPHEQKSLAEIAHALLRLTDGAGPKDQKDSYSSSDIRQRLQPEPERNTPEIEREMNRLRSANQSVRMAAEELWKRTGMVIRPPSPTEAGLAVAIENCYSALGNDIQQAAITAEEAASSLRYLAESLAL
jgi:hypothetical protein